MENARQHECAVWLGMCVGSVWVSSINTIESKNTPSDDNDCLFIVCFPSIYSAFVQALIWLSSLSAWYRCWSGLFGCCFYWDFRLWFFKQRRSQTELAMRKTNPLLSIHEGIGKRKRTASRVSPFATMDIPVSATLLQLRQLNCQSWDECMGELASECH